MAQQGIRLDQENFCCSICLDLLMDPVTIPCGHSYCMGCLQRYWDRGDQENNHSCPQCRQTFIPRPVLVRNTLLAVVVEELKKTNLQTAPADRCCEPGPADVGCDVCSGSKLKAIKSCLQCLASYCQQHLQPHYDSPTFKKHKLVDPSQRLQVNICLLHDEVMKMFCRTDQQCVCYLCSVEEHRGHDTVSAAAERSERQRELQQNQHNVQQRIQDIERDMGVLQQEVETINYSADQAVMDSEEMFTLLISLMEKRRSDVKQQITLQQQTEVSRAEELLEKFEQEIIELRSKDAELQKLSHTQDHIQFLQEFTAMPHPREASALVCIEDRPLRYFDRVIRAISKATREVEENLREGWMMISNTLMDIDVLLSPAVPKTRDGFLKHSHPITMDPNTVNTRLSLSEGNRKVTCKWKHQVYSDHPDRFTNCAQVLSAESLTGRCYWEMEWNGREVQVAVAYKDVEKQWEESRFGCNKNSWSIQYSEHMWTFRHNSTTTQLCGPWSSRVGVYLDHSAGRLSFYSVSDTMILLYRVQTTFTQPLHAGVWLSDFGNTAEFIQEECEEF